MKAAAVIFAFVYFVLVKSQEVLDQIQQKDILQKLSISQIQQQQQQQQEPQKYLKQKQIIQNNKKQDKREIYGGYDLNNPRSIYGTSSTTGYDPYWGYNYNGYNYYNPNNNNNLITPSAIGYNPAFTSYPATSSIGYNPAVTGSIVNGGPWYSSAGYKNINGINGLKYRGNYNNKYNPYTARVIGLNDNDGYNSYNYGGYYNNRLGGYRGYNAFPTSNYAAGGIGYAYGPGISGYNY